MTRYYRIKNGKKVYFPGIGCQALTNFGWVADNFEIPSISERLDAVEEAITEIASEVYSNG